MSAITWHDIKSLYKQHGYPFDEKPFQVNLFGIRSKDMLVDEFNDIIGIAYVDNFNNYQCLVFNGTTKPGLYYLKNKLGNINGTFILKPGFYQDCFTRGKHSGKYNAIVQYGYGIFKGWRDKDSDSMFDMDGKIYDDVTGLNLHTTSWVSEIEKVGPYSAGCQVIQDEKDFVTYRAIAYKSMDIWRPTLSYALFQR